VCVLNVNADDNAAAVDVRAEMGQVLWRLKAWIDDNNFYAHFPVEVRFVPRDDSATLLSLSPDSDVCFINILMYRSNSYHLLVNNVGNE